VPWRLVAYHTFFPSLHFHLFSVVANLVTFSCLDLGCGAILQLQVQCASGLVFHSSSRQKLMLMRPGKPGGNRKFCV
jgi:hypothetical protein